MMLTAKKMEHTSDRPSNRDSSRVQQLLYHALVVAVEFDRNDVVKVLTEDGVNVNLDCDNDIGSALFVAAKCSSLASASVLLKAGADIEQTSTDRLQTALMCAAEFGHLDMLRLLIERGANINRQTAECSAALTIACHFGQGECANFLLDNGADPRMKNPWNYTALYMATDSPDIVRRLLTVCDKEDVNYQCGERQEVALHLASIIGSVPSLTMLIEAGAELNIRTKYNENAVWLATWKGQTEVVRILVQHNAEIDVPSNGWQVYIWHYLPIEIAIGLEHFAIMRLLLQAGCSLQNPHISNGDHVSPLPDIDWLRLRPETFDLMKADDCEMRWFIQLVCNPRRLKDICRVMLRKYLGIPLMDKLTKLYLPSSMKLYLAFHD